MEFVFTFRVYEHNGSKVPEQCFVAVTVIAPHIAVATQLFKQFFPDVTEIDENNIGCRPVDSL